MDKSQRNRMINSLEATKSLITQAQGQLEDEKVDEAQESVNSAFINLKEALYTLNSNLKGGRSTEHM